METRQQIVVGLVIIDNGEVLILRRSPSEDSYPGWWELPSGKKEPGETCEAAARREAKEETGLDVSLGHPCDVFDYTIAKDDHTRETTQVSFLATSTTARSASHGAEHDRIAWVRSADLDGLQMSDETRAAIRAGLELADLTGAPTHRSV